MYNRNPEQIARDKIDKMLIDAEWIVQSKEKYPYAFKSEEDYEPASVLLERIRKEKDDGK